MEEEEELDMDRALAVVEEDECGEESNNPTKATRNLLLVVLLLLLLRNSVPCTSLISSSLLSNSVLANAVVDIDTILDFGGRRKKSEVVGTADLVAAAAAAVAVHVPTSIEEQTENAKSTPHLQEWG